MTMVVSSVATCPFLADWPAAADVARATAERDERIAKLEVEVERLEQLPSAGGLLTP